MSFRMLLLLSVALPLASIVRDLFRLLFDKAVAEDQVLVPMTGSLAEPGPRGSQGSRRG